VISLKNLGSSGRGFQVFEERDSPGGETRYDCLQMSGSKAEPTGLRGVVPHNEKGEPEALVIEPQAPLLWVVRVVGRRGGL